MEKHHDKFNPICTCIVQVLLYTCYTEGLHQSAWFADDNRSVRPTGQQLSDLHVRRLPKQPHQSRYAAAVLQGDFVVVIGFAVHQVPEGPAGAAVHVGHPVVQQVDQQLDPTLPTDLSAAKRSVGEK